jgi:hypothetical protein
VSDVSDGMSDADDDSEDIHNQPSVTEKKVEGIDANSDVLLYYKYFYEYNYYKIALMLTKSKDRKVMNAGIFKMIRHKLNKFRKQKGLL